MLGLGMAYQVLKENGCLQRFLNNIIVTSFQQNNGQTDICIWKIIAKQILEVHMKILVMQVIGKLNKKYKSQ